MMYGVYRVTKDGTHLYVPRSATPNKKLAEEIAQSLSDGEMTLPDGSIQYVRARPHIVKEIGK